MIVADQRATRNSPPLLSTSREDFIPLCKSLTPIPYAGLFCIYLPRLRSMQAAVPNDEYGQAFKDVETSF